MSGNTRLWRGVSPKLIWQDFQPLIKAVQNLQDKKVWVNGRWEFHDAMRDRESTVIVITIGNRVWCVHCIPFLRCYIDDPVSSLFHWRNYERDPCECFWQALRFWRSLAFFICKKWNQRYLEQTHWSLEAFAIQLYKLSEALKWHPQVKRPVERFVKVWSVRCSAFAHLQVLTNGPRSESSDIL